MTRSNAIGVNLVAMGLDDPSSRPRILQIDAPAEAFHRSPRYRPRPEPWKGVTLKVPRLVSISGHVLDPDGRPAANAKVHWGREGDLRLQRKLEPDPARPRYILTEPGAGYRLVNPDAPP